MKLRDCVAVLSLCGVVKLIHADTPEPRKCMKCLSYKSIEDCSRNQTLGQCGAEALGCLTKHYSYTGEHGYVGTQYWYKDCCYKEECLSQNTTKVYGKTRHITRCCGNHGCYLGDQYVSTNLKTGHLRCPSCYSNISLQDCEHEASIVECTADPLEICMYRYSVYDYLGGQRTWYKGCRSVSHCRNGEVISTAQETLQTNYCNENDCENTANGLLHGSYIILVLFACIVRV